MAVKENCVPEVLTKLVPSVTCARPLTKENEDKGNYSLGWKHATDSYSDKTLNQWRYQSSSHYQTLIKYGPSGRFYSSGGYFLNLARNSLDSNTIVLKMKDANWISKAAEVIFVDMSMYSPNTRKIIVVCLCLELRRTIGVDHRFRMIYLPANTSFTTREIVFSIILVMVILSLTAHLIFSISETGTVFFRSIWNILDIIIVALFTLSYIFSLKYSLLLKFNIDEDLRSGQEKFFYFGWLQYHTYFYYYLFALLFVCSSIKLFKYFVDTLQVLPIVMTIRSAWNLISRLTLFVVPFFYVKYKVIDSLLFNSQMTSNRFPLVNKIGLKNYAYMYTFPEKKLLPYLYCQLCSLFIGLFSVFLAYHYRITKNRVLLTSNTTDLLFELKKWIQSGKRIERLNMWKGLLKTKSRKRLRSGADCCEKPQPTTADSSLLGKQNTNKKLEDGENRLKVADPIVYSNEQIGKEKNRDMNKVLENITMKLDKIEKNLRAINESLKDQEVYYHVC